MYPPGGALVRLERLFLFPRKWQRQLEPLAHGHFVTLKVLISGACTYRFTFWIHPDLVELAISDISFLCQERVHVPLGDWTQTTVTGTLWALGPASFLCRPQAAPHLAQVCLCLETLLGFCLWFRSWADLQQLWLLTQGDRKAVSSLLMEPAHQLFLLW